MFDQIEKKVEDIRKQPEHIRVRYVWGAVAITMFFVIFIWLLSMKTNFTQLNNDPETQESIDELQKRIDEMNVGGTTSDSVSIDDLLEQNAADSGM